MPYQTWKYALCSTLIFLLTGCAACRQFIVSHQQPAHAVVHQNAAMSPHYRDYRANYKMEGSLPPAPQLAVPVVSTHHELSVAADHSRDASAYEAAKGSYSLQGVSAEIANIESVGGQVYRVGSYININLPTDELFVASTAEWQAQADMVLPSVLAIIQHFPEHRVLIAGHTGGFSSANRELHLSDARARQFALYLRAHRITYFVGYGDYFPVANNWTHSGLRDNRRLHIIISPDIHDPDADQHYRLMNNIGSLKGE